MIYIKRRQNFYEKFKMLDINNNANKGAYANFDKTCEI